MILDDKSCTISKKLPLLTLNISSLGIFQEDIDILRKLQWFETNAHYLIKCFKNLWILVVKNTQDFYTFEKIIRLQYLFVFIIRYLKIPSNEQLCLSIRSNNEGCTIYCQRT